MENKRQRRSFPETAQTQRLHAQSPTGHHTPSGHYTPTGHHNTPSHHNASGHHSATKSAHNRRSTLGDVSRDTSHGRRGSVAPARKGARGSMVVPHHRDTDWQREGTAGLLHMAVREEVQRRVGETSFSYSKTL